MPLPSPQSRFLLRGSLLLIGMLGLWWAALTTPLLVVLRVSEGIILGLMPGGSASAIRVDDSGDWDFRVPVDDTRMESGGPVQVRSIDFTMPREDVILFTFSWPVFWALMLAAPDVKSHLRVLLWGTLLMWLVEAILLLGAVEIATQTAVANWHPPSRMGVWWRYFGSSLITNVMPFFAPVALAIGLHHELRDLIIPGSGVKAGKADGSRARK